MSDDLRHIEREIRDWTARPPARSPRVARTRILARIEDRGARRRWLFAAAAAMVVVLAVGLLLPRAPEAPSGEPVEIAAAETPPSSSRQAGEAGLLVYELESGTKLYMALVTPLAKTTMEGN